MTAQPARRIPIWLAIVAASLPMFMATLDNLVITNALPVISRDLGASVEELQWFVNAYTLSFASFMLMAVALGDRFGRRTRLPRRHRGLHRSPRRSAPSAPNRGCSSSPAPSRASAPPRSCRCR